MPVEVDVGSGGSGRKNRERLDVHTADVQDLSDGINCGHPRVMLPDRLNSRFVMGCVASRSGAQDDRHSLNRFSWFST